MDEVLGSCDVVVGAEVGVGVDREIDADVDMAGGFPILRNAYQSVFFTFPSSILLLQVGQGGKGY